MSPKLYLQYQMDSLCYIFYIFDNYCDMKGAALGKKERSYGKVFAHFS